MTTHPTLHKKEIIKNDLTCVNPHCRHIGSLDLGTCYTLNQSPWTFTKCFLPSSLSIEVHTLVIQSFPQTGSNCYCLYQRGRKLRTEETNRLSCSAIWIRAIKLRSTRQAGNVTEIRERRGDVWKTGVGEQREIESSIAVDFKMFLSFSSLVIKVHTRIIQ
jgi:hypothetical protein